jgi:catechol 2,3-dioxygenase-like lactoylglutathione lyase family enzyme
MSAASNPIHGGTASVYVSNMDRSIAFYRDVLGFPLLTRVGETWAEHDAGAGLIIGLHPANPPATPAPGTSGAISLELRTTRPLDEVVRQLRDRGVEFAGEIVTYPAVRLIPLLDPDRNALILVELLPI